MKKSKMELEKCNKIIRSTPNRSTIQSCMPSFMNTSNQPQQMNNITNSRSQLYTFYLLVVYFIHMHIKIHILLNSLLFKSMINIHSMLLWLALLIFVSDAREFETSFTFRDVRRNQGWLYLDKIALSQGTTNIKVQTTRESGQSFGTSGQIFFDIVLEQDWQKQQQKKCDAQIRKPVIIHKLLLDGSSSISQIDLTIQKSQVYYFVLKDCNKRFIMDYSNEKMFMKLKIYTLHNGSHFGEEEDDHWMIIPVIILVGFWLLFSDKNFLEDAARGSPDYIKMVLFGGIATNISSLFWKSIGYIIYYFFGVNYLLFHLIYLFMHSLSETIVIGLLMMLGLGWSINYQGQQHLDIIMPGFCLIASINIATTMLTQISNSSYDMHHTFDAVAGTVLIIERLCISFFFVCALVYTYTQSRHKVKKFLLPFGIAAFVYICATPIVVTLANNFVQFKDRNQFVFVGVQILKTICNISLRYMVISPKSDYNKINYKNSSFMPENSSMF